LEGGNPQKVGIKKKGKEPRPSPPCRKNNNKFLSKWGGEGAKLSDGIKDKGTKRQDCPGVKESS